VPWGLILLERCSLADGGLKEIWEIFTNRPLNRYGVEKNLETSENAYSTTPPLKPANLALPLAWARCIILRRLH